MEFSSHNPYGIPVLDLIILSFYSERTRQLLNEVLNRDTSWNN